MEAYCVRDKKKVKILHPQRRVTANGKAQVVGECPLCHNDVYRFVPMGSASGSAPKVATGSTKKGAGLYF